MRLREWHEKEVRGKKMCVECMEVSSVKSETCPKCTCSVFYFLSRLIPIERIDRIVGNHSNIEKAKSVIEIDIAFDD